MYCLEWNEDGKWGRQEKFGISDVDAKVGVGSRGLLIGATAMNGRDGKYTGE
jgi:hypothetical protein